MVIISKCIYISNLVVQHNYVYFSLMNDTSLNLGFEKESNSVFKSIKIKYLVIYLTKQVLDVSMKELIKDLENCKDVSIFMDWEVLLFPKTSCRFNTKLYPNSNSLCSRNGIAGAIIHMELQLIPNNQNSVK